MGEHARAWTLFWRDQDHANPCCANAPEIQQPMEDHWASFARSLPSASSVLDLGCGSGAAGRALIAGNPQLRVTGVDFASVPASGDPRLEILANTRMEQLPFADRSFDAAVSQFAFEYGSVEDAAAELSRVLRPGAPVSLLVHHSEARIAADSVAHRQALEAICRPAFASAFLSGNAATLGQQLSLIRQRHPHERIVEQAGQGLMRHLAAPAPQREQIWQAVKAALEPELVMLTQLEDAAVSPERMAAWIAPLAARFALRPPAPLRMSSGQLLCWKVEGIRRATFH